MYTYLTKDDSFWQITQLAKDVTIQSGNKESNLSDTQRYSTASQARRTTKVLTEKKLAEGYDEAERTVSLEALEGFFNDTLNDELITDWAKGTSNPEYVRDILRDCGVMRALEVKGNLIVPGNFRTFDHKIVSLIVHGDLIVDGCFQDSTDPQTCTIVRGNLICNSVYTSGQLEVLGDLTCEMLVGDYNDYSCAVQGSATADVFFAENHHFEIETRNFAAELGGTSLTYGEVSKMFVSKLLSMPPEDLVGMPDAEVEEIQSEKYFDIETKVIQQAARKCDTLRRV